MPKNSTSLDVDDPANADSRGLRALEDSLPEETDQEGWAGTESNPELVAGQDIDQRADDMGIYRNNKDGTKIYEVDVLGQLQENQQEDWES